MQAAEGKRMSNDEPVPPPALTVSAVAARLGVAPSTLRTWDRRYSLGPSDHTAGSHRRYSGADIARLMVMRRLTLEGVAPVDAARIALATAVENHMPEEFFSGGSTYLPDVPLSAHDGDTGYGVGYGPGSRGSGSRGSGSRSGSGGGFGERAGKGGVKRGSIAEILGGGKKRGFSAQQLASRDNDTAICQALVDAATDFNEVAAIQLVQAVVDVRGIGDTWAQIVKSAVKELLGSSELVHPGMDPLSVIKSAVMMSLRRAARQLEREERAAAEVAEGARADDVVEPGSSGAAGSDGEGSEGAGSAGTAGSDGSAGAASSSAFADGADSSASGDGAVRRIMVCASPDDVSSLGAHVLAAALNQVDAPSAVLLGQVTPAAVKEVLRQQAPDVIVVVSWSGPSSRMIDAVELCIAKAPQIPVLLTGPGWPRKIPAGAHRVRTFIGALHEAQAYFV